MPSPVGLPGCDKPAAPDRYRESEDGIEVRGGAVANAQGCVRHILTTARCRADDGFRPRRTALPKSRIKGLFLLLMAVARLTARLGQKHSGMTLVFRVRGA